MAGVILGVLILAAAACILIRRAVRFARTRGRSACENCPYAKSCSGECKTKN